MRLFTINAFHTNGQSDTHPCWDGAWDDPVDILNGQQVYADTPREAEDKAYLYLDELVANQGSCKCGRENRAGKRWWFDSVVVIARST